MSLLITCLVISGTIIIMKQNHSVMRGRLMVFNTSALMYMTKKIDAPNYHSNGKTPVETPLTLLQNELTCG